MSGEGGNKHIDIVDGTKAIAIIIIIVDGDSSDRDEFHELLPDNLNYVCFGFRTWSVAKEIIIKICQVLQMLKFVTDSNNGSSQAIVCCTDSEGKNNVNSYGNCIVDGTIAIDMIIIVDGSRCCVRNGSGRSWNSTGCS